MKGDAALVGVVEIDRDAPLKLPELAFGAGIADRIDGESDVRSRGVDAPIRGQGGGRRGLREEAKREHGANDAGALEYLPGGHEAPHTIFVIMNIRGGRVFVSVRRLHRLVTVRRLRELGVRPPSRGG